MIVQVKLTSDSDWQEVDVVGFYDPAKHKTVRVNGDAKKVPYFQMKMQDGRVYDKELGNWILYRPENKMLDITSVPDLPLCYDSGSIKSATISDRILERVDDFVYLMKECHRVLAIRGVVSFTVALAPTPYAFSDPEFKNYFTEETFKFFLRDNRYDLFTVVNTTVRGHVMEVTLRK